MNRMRTTWSAQIPVFLYKNATATDTMRTDNKWKPLGSAQIPVFLCKNATKSEPTECEPHGSAQNPVFLHKHSRCKRPQCEPTTECETPASRPLAVEKSCLPAADPGVFGTGTVMTCYDVAKRRRKRIKNRIIYLLCKTR